MAVSSKEIKRRIKSVKNIGQITKAMELVSAAKMRKAQALAKASRPYSVLSTELLKNLSGKVSLDNQPLINRPENPQKQSVNKDLVILITSDRGLAGAFNSNVINKVLALVRENKDSEFEFITIGKKGSDAVRKLNKQIVATFPIQDKNVSIFDAKPVAEIAINDFLGYKYNRVFIIYTDFVSTLTQKPNAMQLLPIAPTTENSNEEFEFEPSADRVLENLVVRTIEFAVYQTLVETSASEHSARMVATRNANEASNELIDELILTANQARQAGITRELAEISAAKLAMEG